MIGLITGLVIVIDCISMAALIFSARLSNHLPAGMGIFLVSTIIIGLIVALKSDYPGNIAHPKSISGAIFAIMGASAVASAKVSPSEVLPTLLAAIMTTTLFAGLFFYLMGRLQFGNLTRYIPYPVVGGFLAGTGWLIVKGSMTVLVGAPVGLKDFFALLGPDLLSKWLPGAVFGVALIVIQRRRQHFLIIPAAMALAFAAFYLYLWLSGMPVQRAFDNGFMMGPFESGSLLRLPDLRALSTANFGFLLEQTGNMMAIIVLSTISLLLNYSGLELSTGRDIDLNRELKVTGVANLAAGVFGGTIGYNSLIFCVLNHKAGASGRLASIVVPVVCGLSLLMGASVFGYLPRIMIGGFIMSLGMGLLVRWLYDSRAEFSKTDYLLVLSILISIAAWGLLQGVVIGIIVAVMIFILNYSRINVVKYTLTSENCQSNVERSIYEKEILKRKGQQVHILWLQGYIFFGTANNILTQVKQRLGAPEMQKLRFLIFNCHAVNGIDSSAIMSFEKIKRLAEENDFHFLISNVSPGIAKLLESSGFLDENDSCLKVFPDLDHTLEWCENQLFKGEGDEAARSSSLDVYLLRYFMSSGDFDRFMKYLSRLEVPAGYTLFRQGDPSSELFFVESGQVSIFLEFGGGVRKRLRSSGPGTVVGEIGVYVDSPRTATVISDVPTVLYRLTVEALKMMHDNEPMLAADFQKFIIQLVSERLMHSNKVLNILLK